MTQLLSVERDAVWRSSARINVQRVACSDRETRAVRSFNPLEDARWNRFIECHPQSSVFHSTAWLKTLHRTYGYQPIAYTTSPAGAELENAIIFCRINSWLTGNRLVSLPFSDHCECLAPPEDARAIVNRLAERDFDLNRWRYIEVRPLETAVASNRLLCTKINYAFHQLSLEPSLGQIFRNFHKNSTQRKIVRAEREGLTYREGNTDGLLNDFYKLFQGMRQRRRVPPQSKKWFSNLVNSFGDALKIRVAYANNRAVASMITIRFKDVMVYKYGSSDPRFNKLGGMHLLFWRSIQEAKDAGLKQFDFGRTDADQQGLITFKDRWGANRSMLTYLRFGQTANSTHFFDLSTGKQKAQVTKYVLSCLPSSVISRVGQLLYRHVG